MTTCCKCKERDATVDIKFAVYCQDCFLEACYHKYRIQLGKAQVNCDMKALLVVGEGLSDRLLLHFSQLPLILEPLRKNIQEFEVLLTAGCTLKAEEISTAYPLITHIHRLSGSATNTLQATLDLAHERGIRVVLISDTSTATAATVLTSICEGRGVVAEWDASAVREYPRGIRVIRPLREISDREVGLYCTLMTGQYLFPSQPPSKEEPIAKSIAQLTGSFLAKLDEENPGTANVVLRTITKVEKPAWSALDRCSVCLAPSACELCYSCTRNRQQ